MHLFSTQPHVVFEVSDPAGGGGAATAAPGVQPAEGQGTQASENNGAFNWGMFPNVPEEHRALLEPHIRGMQGYVTQLEQQLAPFRAFEGAGLTPEATQGLLQFSADFDRDPRGMWIRIGQMLQESGDVDPEVDLDYLAAIASGQDPDAGQQPVEMNGQVQETGANAALMQQIQNLEQQIQELRQNGEQERARRTEAIQDQLLAKRMDNMREELTKAGWPADLLTDETLTAQIMAYRGNIAAATKAMVDQRSGILKGFTDNRNPEGDDLDLSGGTPPVPGERTSSRDDTWSRARSKATQRLRQTNRANAQA